jgi:hypothetical protein
MTIYLKQSTASQEVPLGYFVDSTDGNTEETALTIANTDIKIWKTGATTLANKNSGGATHISNGIYYAVLDATDTNTLGSLVIYVHVAGALSVKLECLVLAANVYDSLIGGGDYLEVDTVAISSDTTAADNAELMFDGTGYAGGTTKLGVDIVSISADTTAADNAELWFDGTAIADSVPADGTRPTPAQALYMITQFLTEASVSSTTLTVKKVDGSTSLMTFTLNSATTPTSITRTT